MQNHDILYEPGEARFYFYEEKQGLWLAKTEDALKTMLSGELGDYWRKFHDSQKVELLPQRTDRMLKDSINQLRGAAEHENAFERSGSKPVIHLKEGMLDLESLTLNEFAPEYFSRNQIPIPFREDAECPRFLNELLAPALSDEAIAVLQKYFGMCILGYNYSQQFLLLEGTAGGGKGTLTDILRNIVGVMNVAEMRTHQLNERFELAAFFDKTLLIGSDVPGNFLQRAGAETLKKLTGHDLIEAEFKGTNKRGRMKGVFNAVITSNNRLRVRLDGDAEAWRRRMILVRFTNPPVVKKIVNFAGHLLDEEGSGILNWMIHGAALALTEFHEHGKIVVPESLQKDADELLYESNTLNNFLDERLVPSPGGDVTTIELQNAYVNYCNSQNLPAQDSRSVATRLADLIPEKFVEGSFLT
ncbi:DNA primase family protein [Victivallis vadensis]|uniref:DNA primase family protein n=1 Tax=Victivallis vadensis TaxID=172901 RepID=UPI00307D8D24